MIIYTKAIIFLIIWIMFAWDLFEKYGPNRNNKKIQHWPFQLNVAEHVLLNAGLAVPGEAHRRNLPFTTYCDLDSSKQKVAVYWPGVPGRLKTVELPVQQIVQNVTLKGVKRIVNDADADGKAELRLSIDISGTPHKNDRYYEVPAFTRWAYGTAYIGLAVFLSYMYFVVIPPRLEDARRKLEMLSVPF